MAHRHQTEIELLFRPGEAKKLKATLKLQGGKSVTETMMRGVDCASASVRQLPTGFSGFSGSLFRDHCFEDLSALCHPTRAA